MNPLLLLILIPCAIAGPIVSYAIGKRLGPKMFSRPRSRFWRPEHLQKAHAFYEKHGGAAIVIARFMPIVRTFVPVVAGLANMPFGLYTAYNVLGGVAWIWSMLFIGHFLGRVVPGIDKHIEPMILVIIALSLLPGVITWWRERSKSKAAASAAAPRAVPDP